MKLTIEFLCPECGLLTPGFAELPDDTDPRRLATFQHECHHCDAPLLRQAKLSVFIKEQKGS